MLSPIYKTLKDRVRYNKKDNEMNLNTTKELSSIGKNLLQCLKGRVLSHVETTRDQANIYGMNEWNPNGIHYHQHFDRIMRLRKKECMQGEKAKCIL